ncbi:MAG: hypothetical protein GQ574_26725 [Crocinitomix sp.]|nr:hypothetical protein [Crocinitomix sp.]
MRTKKELFDQLDECWSGHRDSMYKVLKPFHVRLIYQRLMNGKSFKELAIRYELNELSAKMLFNWCIKQIKERVDRDFADLLNDCHAFIIAKESRGKIKV